MTKEPLKSPLGDMEETSHLRDSDWTADRKMREAYANGGQAALKAAIRDLATNDPISYMNVMSAYFPDMVREAIRDEMAEAGMSEQDLRELIRKLESGTDKVQ